jgi:hypothetical protein
MTYQHGKAPADAPLPRGEGGVMIPFARIVVNLGECFEKSEVRTDGKRFIFPWEIPGEIATSTAIAERLNNAFEQHPLVVAAVAYVTAVDAMEAAERGNEANALLLSDISVALGRLREAAKGDA